MSSGRFVRIPLILLALSALAIISDVVGARLLEREERKWRQLSSDQRELLQRHRRQIVIGDAVDQNAATWYRLAFEKVKPRTTDMHRTLLPLVTGSVRPGAERLEMEYRESCSEAESPRMKSALACTLCDWEVPYDFRVDTSADEWFQGMVLAECVALNGWQLLERRDWANSAKAFLTTLSIAQDFDQGSLEMNIVGVAAAQWAARGFAEALSWIDDSSQIDTFSQQFARFEASMPSFRVGLIHRQLAAAIQATSLARAYVGDHRYGFRVFLPWRTVAAWRLSRQERIVSKVGLLMSSPERTERSRLVTELSESGPMSAPIVPSTFTESLSQQDQLIQVAHAARTVIDLQRAYAKDGKYPRVAPAGITSLQYERTSEGKGYRLMQKHENGALELFLERKPDVRSN